MDVLLSIYGICFGYKSQNWYFAHWQSFVEVKESVNLHTNAYKLIYIYFLFKTCSLQACGGHHMQAYEHGLIFCYISQAKVRSFIAEKLNFSICGNLVHSNDCCEQNKNLPQGRRMWILLFSLGCMIIHQKKTI